MAIVTRLANDAYRVMGDLPRTRAHLVRWAEIPNSRRGLSDVRSTVAGLPTGLELAERGRNAGMRLGLRISRAP
jgi:hypothetical protein